MRNEHKICPNESNHADQPGGYIEFHDWAKKMNKTHKQEKCPDCGLYLIWKPKKQTEVWWELPKQTEN